MTKIEEEVKLNYLTIKLVKLKEIKRLENKLNAIIAESISLHECPMLLKLIGTTVNNEIRQIEANIKIAEKDYEDFIS